MEPGACMLTADQAVRVVFTLFVLVMLSDALSNNLYITERPHRVATADLRLGVDKS